jgi:hypothetical protein
MPQSGCQKHAAAAVEAVKQIASEWAGGARHLVDRFFSPIHYHFHFQRRQA